MVNFLVYISHLLNQRPFEYKPSQVYARQKCIRTSISAALICEILRYIIYLLFRSVFTFASIIIKVSSWVFIAHSSFRFYLFLLSILLVNSTLIFSLFFPNCIYLFPFYYKNFINITIMIWLYVSLFVPPPSLAPTKSQNWKYLSETITP